MMLFSILSQAGILSSLIFHTYALPFKPQEYVDRFEAQKRASYSVVEVDGSAATTTPPVTTPIIETVTQTLKDIKTVTASPIIPSVSKQTITEVVTQPSSTKISLLPPERTTTSTSSYRIVDSAGTTTPPLAHSMMTTIIVPTSSIGSMRNSTTTVAPTSSTTLSQTTSLSYSSSLVTHAVVSPPTASSNSLQTSITTTSTYTLQPTTTRTTYDDGFWHTFYPYHSPASTPTSDPYDTGAGSPSLAIEVDAPRNPAQLGSLPVT